MIEIFDYFTISRMLEKHTQSKIACFSAKGSQRISIFTFIMSPIPKHIIISVDGHSSSGKSTFAKAIAEELNITYIDSGAMYRVVTLYCLKNNLIRNSDIDLENLKRSIDDIRIEFRYNKSTGQNDTYMDGENVEDEIRDVQVSQHVSPVSKIGFVREKMVALQREMAQHKGVVMDGRDIGSVVFPDADIKIFLTASNDVRAKRRFDELKAKGMEVSLEEIKYNITDRDHQDSTREISPLVKPENAIELDNNNMMVEEQMIWFRNLIKEKYGE